MTSSSRSQQIPTIHRDPTTNRRVFIAPQRADRPMTLDVDGTGQRLDEYRHQAHCPFCAGNENLVPPEILRWPVATSEPWQARIVANRFPAVIDQLKHSKTRDAVGGTPAHGIHDVVIESATHEHSILAITPQAWRAIWELCRCRLESLEARKDIAWGILFKNSGLRAGASLEHLHSQLIAIDFIPPLIRSEMNRASKHPGLFTRVIEEAAKEGRVLCELGNLVALVPNCPRQPFETWIVPSFDESCFHAASRTSIDAIADLTRLLIQAFERIEPSMNYNWWLHSAPFRHIRNDSFRWHLEIVPRTEHFAGFELGSGCHIHSLPAREAARLLKEAW